MAKSTEPSPGDDVALGDQSSMLFQNTSVTRGSAQFLVTATGMNTEVGHIAGMLGESPGPGRRCRPSSTT